MSPSLPASPRQRTLLFAGLGAVAAALVLFRVVLPMMSAGDAGAVGSGAAAPAIRAAAAGDTGAVEEVALAKLEQPWPDPVSSRRNPFSMAADPPPAVKPPPSAKPADTALAQPVGPPPPPPVPPITLKFIGVVSGPQEVGKIAALSDGKFVYRGREGQIVEGRYRIVRIGEESIQIEYANGTGRQTIRLSGK